MLLRLIRESKRVKISFLVFLLLFGSFAYFQHSEPGWNVNSRFALSLALAETGSPVVDRYVTLPGLETQDLAEYAGHLYSDKSIGTSLLGVPAVWVVKGIEAAGDTTFSTATRRWLVTLLSVGLAGAVSGVLLMHWLSMLWQRRALDDSYFVMAGPTPAAAFTAVAVTLGTMLFLYGTLFMSYLPAQMFLLATLLTLELAITSNSDETGKMNWRPLALFLLAGIFGGLSALCEYTYAAALVIMAVYLVQQMIARKNVAVEMDSENDVHLQELRVRARTTTTGVRSAFAAFTAYGIGGLIGVAPFIVYTMTVFGRPTIPYEYHVMPQFRQAMAQGFMGAGVPSPDVLWLITFHPFRGVFVYSPLLLAGFAGLIWMAVRRQYSSLRAVVCLCLACSIFYFLFNSAYYMWWGGWSFSPRHLAPAIPFIAAGLLPWFSRLWCRVVAVALAAVGVAVHTLVNATEPQPPDGGWQTALLRPDFAAFDYPAQFADTVGRVNAGAIDTNLGVVLGLPANLVSLLPLLLWWAILGYLIVRQYRNHAGDVGDVSVH